ncbi:MAG: AzlC family ABC transporter permease [Clostridia bacterium]|nr:AzlC family ABC transporter permease [Clostridia bacterium]
MQIQKNTFLKGIIDGIPICLGYLSVSFAFGIFSVESGLSILEAVLISMTNVTSAGQLAAVPIITGGGAFLELAATQLVINLRYALMSVSLSQKLHPNVRLFDRFIISFVNTDEVFAVASSNTGEVKRNYLYGLILTPYLGWASGTLLGAVAGNILPAIVISSLGVAIYAMFVAIVVPEAKKRSCTAMCVVFAIALSCVFKYTPLLCHIPQGFVIIICAVAASALFAAVMPIPQPESEDI